MSSPGLPPNDASPTRTGCVPGGRRLASRGSALGAGMLDMEYSSEMRDDARQDLQAEDTSNEKAAGGASRSR